MPWLFAKDARMVTTVTQVTVECSSNAPVGLASTSHALPAPPSTSKSSRATTHTKLQDVKIMQGNKNAIVFSY